MTDRFGMDTTSGVSAAFDLLRDTRRRGVIYTVRRNGRTSVDEIARRIAAWESDDTNPETVEVSLVHTHLPKLADGGAVEYDSENGVVEPTETTDDLEPLLDCTREREPELFYLARTSNPEGTFEA